MRWPVSRLIPLTFIALLLGVLIVSAGCEYSGSAGPTAPNRSEASTKDSFLGEGVALDRKLTEVYLHRDWPALAAIVAPDY
jgi:hypothetical protein